MGICQSKYKVDYEIENYKPLTLMKLFKFKTKIKKNTIDSLYDIYIKELNKNKIL